MDGGHDRNAPHDIAVQAVCRLFQQAGGSASASDHTNVGSAWEVLRGGVLAFIGRAKRGEHAAEALSAAAAFGPCLSESSEDEYCMFDGMLTFIPKRF